MNNVSPLKNLIFLIILFFTLQILSSSLLLYNYSLTETRQYLQRVVQRVSEDVKYENGKWDTSLYNADGTIPDSNPLYIITSDGFVIERWKPIHGLLDSTQFNRLITYSKPETINTITNEHWRVLSEEIVSNKKVVGVITVSAYKPEENTQDLIDEQLRATLHSLKNDLKIDRDTIDVSHIDARKLPHTITFQIVNRFNKLLIQNDNTTSITRSPTFIDASYIDDQIENKENTIVDTQTKQRYLTLTTPILDKNKSMVGIIVAGSPIDTFYTFSNKYTATIILITIGLLCLFIPILRMLLSKHIDEKVKMSQRKIITQLPKKILYSKKDCCLIIDEKRIQIPYASYQYYLCDALFSKPSKRWEVDELLEKFGEEITPENWRKIYDTMVALNKKVHASIPQRLIIVHNKTYRLNPLLLPLLAK